LSIRKGLGERYSEETVKRYSEEIAVDFGNKENEIMLLDTINNSRW
jgi:hypothetical protein